MSPSSRPYPAMPSSRNRDAPANAHRKECVRATMYPVMIGAAMAAIWEQKLSTPPTRPTLFRGAIREGMDHATGAEAARPESATVIHTSAVDAVRAVAAPIIA